MGTYLRPSYRDEHSYGHLSRIGSPWHVEDPATDVCFTCIDQSDYSVRTAALCGLSRLISLSDARFFHMPELTKSKTFVAFEETVNLAKICKSSGRRSVRDLRSSAHHVFFSPLGCERELKHRWWGVDP